MGRNCQSRKHYLDCKSLICYNIFLSISKSLRGYTRTTEHQEKINKSLKGRDPSFSGKSHTEETKVKLRELHIGKKRKPMSIESKAKLSEKMKQIRKKNES